MQEFICKFCSKKFNSQESLQQHENAKHAGQENTKKSNAKSKYIKIFLLVLIVLLSSYMAYSYAIKPGQYDNFAKCLTAKGVVIYGNDFCRYTAKQLNWFGKSKKYLNYVKCIENEELCNSKGVKTTPTWEIDGKMYEQVQTFEKLSLLTGCKIE